MLNKISLDQFELAPSQVWGNVRLIPIIRKSYQEDLRLGIQQYDEDMTLVALDGKPGAKFPSSMYCSYVPHGVVARWSTDNTSVVPYGCELEKAGKKSNSRIRVEHRMAKREGDRQLRFLPLHLAMEGFLSLCFGGPDVAWSEYSSSVLRHGLGARYERSIRGRQTRDLEDALRVFEIHEHQVGVVILVADAPASIFIVPHPSDYRLMHKGLIEDFYGELIFYNGQSLYDAPDLDLGLEDVKVNQLEDLDKLLNVARNSYSKQQKDLLRGILSPKVESKLVNQLGPFTLQRFTTDLSNDQENFIGEALIRDDGQIEYLKTYQLSRSQAKRGFLLKSLAKNGWNLEDTAASFGCSQNELIKRMDNAGFGYFLKQHILDAAIKKVSR
ncbi:hypothetical protein [Pleionea sp. CnH1-48]|uniref:ARPP-2 domain-containing protein n=1 Tax=Pleionea sp. CnH1-48 TaxID=2954494 RepID=UPI002097928B|nr:hypothetical protein [Pleionea sp. CnH1-48]MCO7223284.1 hypothetical protein [Pleionea sp. CnH1-48]